MSFGHVSWILFLFSAIFFWSCKRSLPPEGQFQDFINSIDETSDKNEADRKISQFLTAHQIPYIQDSSAYFLLRGDAKQIELTGDFTGWENHRKMRKISNTDLWYLRLDFPSDARFGYKFILDHSEWITDPLNPRNAAGGFGVNSELRMESYIPPWETIADTTIAQGKLDSLSIESAILKKAFQLKVYQPPFMDSTGSADYATAYFHDGNDYLNFAQANIILDNLIQKKLIRPLIGVFVQPNDRNAEYAFDEKEEYCRFFVEELVPFIDDHYPTKPDPQYRGTFGPSFGGNISAYIGFYHPDVFGFLGIQSGAFWPEDLETYHLFHDNGTKPLEIASIWGSYYDVQDVQRRFSKNMEEKGYQIWTKEYPESHSWGLWRATLDELLMRFDQK